jgi:hypothetical protein
MTGANNSLNDTTNTFSTLEDKMSKRLLFRKVKRIVCFFCALFFTTLLILFLSLPVFQVKGMKISGLVNFTKEEILSLADVGEDRLNLMFDSTASSNRVVEVSKGLILECDFENNGVLSSASVVENSPVCSYKGEVYLSSGLSMSNALSTIESLGFTVEQKTQLKDRMSAHTLESLPSVHLPKSMSDKDDVAHASVTFSNLRDIPYSSLSTIQGIQYINQNADSNYSNVAEFLLRDGTNYYLLKKVLSDYIQPFFSNSTYPDYVFENMRAMVTNKKMETTSYSFQDEEDKTYEVYIFQLVRQDGKLTVSSLTKEE